MRKSPAIGMPELLYFGRGSTPSATMHRHPFHQMEYCLSGRLLYSTGGEPEILRPGEYLLLPPESPHTFTGRKEPYEYLSLKFNCDAEIPFCRGDDPVVRFLLDFILGVVGNSEKAIQPFSPEGKFVVENLLHGILCRLLTRPSVPGRPPESQFISAIRETVYKHGYEININRLAELFHCSRTEFYCRFKRECDNRTKAKRFVDGILVDMAKKHLRFSSMTISGIAAEMKFPSIYVFSRFFKHLTGVSPLQYRRSLEDSELPPAADRRRPRKDPPGTDGDR